ncbi:hypothetical protein CIB84_007672 [Bambusicola thoracicus]|uniref:Uncharacterized protein n=1 Tax=Bambusicola thoracicus TaxID=9083 RepID=A0A2P4SWW8_BAMTH|nr:hypothetical protein CIB84_007672 [Bambusicola thoracicus]
MSVQALLGDKSFLYIGITFPLCNVILIADDLRLHNDLQVTKKESQVILYWNNNLTKEETEKYTVKYILNYTFFDTSQKREIVDVTEEKYEYPLLRPAKKCTAQVRAKKEVCITNKIWSDWSEPVIIYDEKIVVDRTAAAYNMSYLHVFGAAS